MYRLLCSDTECNASFKTQSLLLITAKRKIKDILDENMLYYLIRALDSFSAMEK